MYISFVRNPKVLETVTAVDHDESAVFGPYSETGSNFETRLMSCDPWRSLHVC